MKTRLAARGLFAPSGDSESGRPLRMSPLVIAGMLCLAAIVAWWTWRAFHDPLAHDTGLAWEAGRVGWATGRPERVGTWNGMTFLAAVMAVLSRLASSRHVADLVTVLNTSTVIALVTAVLVALRRRLAPGWWWIVAFGLVSFGPLMSTVWWKQFNILALAAAAVGFELARRGRRGAGLAIALSVSIKPMIFLLPLILLARRETRRIGAAAILWILAIDVAAQALFALRAGNLATLDPTIGPRNMIHRTSAAGNPFLCIGINFSPTSLLCRLNGGFVHWTLQRILVVALIALAAAWVIQALRARPALSWEWFAFAAPFSIMLGPLSWAHYQVMLAPLFVLMLVRLTESGTAAEWLGLGVAFVMASLIWAPFGNVVDGLRGQSENPQTTAFLGVYAQLAQYVLVLAATFWYARRGPLLGGEPRSVPRSGVDRIEREHVVSCIEEPPDV